MPWMCEGEVPSAVESGRDDSGYDDDGAAGLRTGS